MKECAVTSRNDKVCVFDALLFSTVDCSIVLSLSVNFVKKTLLMYGNIHIVKNC
jgi:hypothetical protein